MGFGRIFGGALEGAGAGISEMAASKELERRQAALENLRSQNTSREQVERAQLTDWADTRKTARDTNAELIVGGQDNAAKAAREEADRKAKAAEKEADRQHDIRMQRIKSDLDLRNDKESAKFKADIESGLIVDTVVGEDGKWVGITKNGTAIRTTITATEKDRIYNPNEGKGSGSTLETLRGGGAATPAPVPSRTPDKAQVKPQQAKNYEPPFIDGAYRIMLDKDAEAFVNNPANKGKKFVGPDGGTYIVK